ncbi:MAG: LysM peptidoglycan-binding domain-containing protein [Candidatus Daviesbacteria bacterium]|nr:LysM peptidoglycan-binding domain-containing protein [Candidatus Daviesbacteria bacterium]
MALEEHIEESVNHSLPSSREVLKEITEASRGTLKWAANHWRGLALGTALVISSGMGISNASAITKYVSENTPTIQTTAEQPLASPLFSNNQSIENISNNPLKKQHERLETVVSVEQTSLMLQDINNKVEEIYNIRSNWESGKSYTAKKGDTYESIAAANNTTIDKILQINKRLSPKSLPEGERFILPVSNLPVPYLGKIFDQAKIDLNELEKIRNEKGASSQEAKDMAQRIYHQWNTSPAESTPNTPPKIIIDPEAKNSEFIAQQIQKSIDLMPGWGRVVNQYIIVPRSVMPDFFAPMGTVIFPDKGADVYVFDMPSKPDRNGKLEPWTERWLQVDLLHENMHAASIYEEFSSRLFSPIKLVELTLKDTQISNMSYLVHPQTSRISERDEAAAWEGVKLFTVRPETTQLPPDMALEKDELDFAKENLTPILGPDFDYIQASQKLGIQ